MVYPAVYPITTLPYHFTLGRRIRYTVVFLETLPTPITTYFMMQKSTSPMYYVRL